VVVLDWLQERVVDFLLKRWTLAEFEHMSFTQLYWIIAKWLSVFAVIASFAIIASVFLFEESAVVYQGLSPFRAVAIFAAYDSTLIEVVLLVLAIVATWGLFRGHRKTSSSVNLFSSLTLLSLLISVCLAVALVVAVSISPVVTPDRVYVIDAYAITPTLIPVVLLLFPPLSGLVGMLIFEPATRGPDESAGTFLQ
jgi:hypothetical protein